MTRPTVLIIEDDPSLRAMERRLAESSGFDVATASDGAEGVAEAARLLPDLVVTDYHMPGMKGPEVISTLRRIPRLQRTPVLVITAETGAQVEQELQRVGAWGVLSKPFVPSAFRSILHRALGQVPAQPPAPPPVERSEPARDNMLVMVLAAAMENAGRADSEDTVRHLQRLSRTAVHLGTLAGLDSRQTGMLRDWVGLHDVGKVSLPTRLLHGLHRFTSAEREEMATHTLLGASILRRAGAPIEAQEIALCHHEQWDGKGHPRGLAGEAIPLLARITAVVDVYDALRSYRPYRPALSSADAAVRLRGLRGTQLDPSLVDLFLSDPLAIDLVYNEFADPTPDSDLEVWR
jgi:response regulator RpfG family c-di-GMP phosphodiesterase